MTTPEERARRALGAGPGTAPHLEAAIAREIREAVEEATSDPLPHADKEAMVQAVRDAGESAGELWLRLDAALALLREVEWKGRDGLTSARQCPLCDGWAHGPLKGHAPDCRLAALLGDTDGPG